MQQDWSEMLSNVVAANQKAVAAATEFSRITVRAQTRMARRQFAAFEDCLDAGSEHLCAVTAGNEVQQTMARHAEIVAELGEKLVAASQETMEIQLQARDELARWMEQGVSEFKAEAGDVLVAKAPARKPRRTARKPA